MYDWHSYGKETIGARSDIENVRIENLQAFYRTYYQPDNAVLIIAGHFELDRTLQLVVDTFGRIPRPKRTLPALWTVEPIQDGERTVTVRRKGDTQIVLVGYHIPAGRSTMPWHCRQRPTFLDRRPAGACIMNWSKAGSRPRCSPTRCCCTTRAWRCSAPS